MEDNYSNDTALIMFFCVLFGFLMILGIAFYLKERFEDIKYAKMELHRSYDEEEYRYWRRELLICRLMIIPFMSYETAKKIVKFFSRGKHAKKEQHNDGLTSLLLPSFLGIMICAVCLAGGTFAWFTALQTTSTQVIKAANYSIETTINDGTTDITADNGVYSLESGKTYKITIEATGSATTGYCIIKLGDTDIHTEQFPTIDNTDKKFITFTLEINQAVDMEIIAQWGTSASKGEKLLNGDTYTHGVAEPIATANTEEEIEQSSTEHTTEATDTGIYTVVSGDTLTSIANKYNTTVDKLIAYNKLPSTNIQVGQKIKIPPTDYEIAKTETTTESSPLATEQKTRSTETSAEETSYTTESDTINSNIAN